MNGFLVLSRKENESVYIGQDIQVKVSRIDCGQVQLAIRAPEHVPILREELIQEVSPETREAVRDGLGRAGFETRPAEVPPHETKGD